ncbi:MGMT family protein [Psychroflexus montanilacus]|uniref:MGMT family protein n=1 Tax=Psychroflexus montanilacus TaxID=2873598 RepID=UPI001CCC0E38|nr:MGMT family protein [Psychroflexus montanilacus]MBZ9652444.1 MGMT family protein [Psychroflexus montanilacus]
MANSDFFEKVYAIVALIPEGKVTSYGAIAKAIGAARSSRTVGYAMNNCVKLDRDLPAHRVVNRNGVLTGKHHFPGQDTMKRLLEEEGLEIEDYQIKNFKSVFWEPSVNE